MTLTDFADCLIEAIRQYQAVAISRNLLTSRWTLVAHPLAFTDKPLPRWEGDSVADVLVQFTLARLQPPPAASEGE